MKRCLYLIIIHERNTTQQL
uniref:Uncharacterized protein n=1 Tax=Anguilla anguilla TaxID=7936 RepID=A0A0E9PF06_ANGAN